MSLPEDLSQAAETTNRYLMYPCGIIKGETLPVGHLTVSINVRYALSALIWSDTRGVKVWFDFINRAVA